MRTYATNDGEKFEAADANAVVRHLRSTSFMESTSDADFMAKMADMVRGQTSEDISVRTPAQFVAGLIEVGLLKEVNPE